jgi:hypothetical protein
VFAAAQGVLAFAVVIAAVSCWFGPKDSWTSRRAKTTCILLGAFLTAVLLFGAGAREVEDWMSLSFGARLTVFLIVLLSALVALAVIGFAWLSVHEAIGRECSDPRLIRAARRLIGVWCLYWLAAFTLIFSISLFSEALGSMLATGLVLVEAIYFRLVRDSCSSIRANLVVDGASASTLANNPV